MGLVSQFTKSSIGCEQRRVALARLAVIPTEWIVAYLNLTCYCVLAKTAGDLLNKYHLEAEML
jgi:hypothetical protein